MSAITDLALGASNLVLVYGVVSGRLETMFRPTWPADPAAPAVPELTPEPARSEVAPGATPNGQSAPVVREWRDGKFTDQP